jgi:hypothetical protein
MENVRAFEVSRVCFNISFGPYPPFPLGSDFGFDRGQELKKQSCRKSLFIRHESGVWAALPRQRDLVEEVNKWLSKKSAEADELRVVHAVLREEAAQARKPQPRHVKTRPRLKRRRPRPVRIMRRCWRV